MMLMMMMMGYEEFLCGAIKFYNNSINQPFMFFFQLHP